MSRAGERASGAAPAPVWAVAAASVRGAAHRAKRRECQDWSGFLPEGGRGAVVSTAVADGHGSAPHFRSRDGALLAVRRMCDALLAHESAAPGRRSSPEDAARLTASVAAAWRRRVEEDLAATPFHVREIEALRAAKGESAVADVLANPVIAYGTTVVGAVAGPAEVFGAMIGDGAAVAAFDDGTVRDLVERNPEQRFGASDSLCSPDPVAAFRTGSLPAAPGGARLVLLATDGFADSYSAADFHARVAAFVGLVRERGIDGVRRELPGWLSGVSDAGSGDDVSVALIVREGPPYAGTERGT